jgi:hypothetical protein
VKRRELRGEWSISRRCTVGEFLQRSALRAPLGGLFSCAGLSVRGPPHVPSLSLGTAQGLRRCACGSNRAPRPPIRRERQHQALSAGAGVGPRLRERSKFAFASLLIGADLNGANLFRVDLRGANLREATLVETDFSGADLTGCRVYGVSAWKVALSANTKQQNLIITEYGEPEITVDNIEVAQFIYLLLHNEKIRVSSTLSPRRRC